MVVGSLGIIKHVGSRESKNKPLLCAIEILTEPSGILILGPEEFLATEDRNPGKLMLPALIV